MYVWWWWDWWYKVAKGVFENQSNLGNLNRITEFKYKIQVKAITIYQKLHVNINVGLNIIFKLQTSL